MGKETSIRKLLKNFEKEELIEVLTELIKSDKKNEQFVNLFIKGSNPKYQKEIVDIAKKKIFSQFYTSTHFPKDEVSLGTARNIVIEYSKLLKHSPVDAADIKLYYVELGSEILSDFGGDDEPLINSSSSMFERFCSDIFKHPRYYENFEQRLDELSKTVENIGYGFSDFINERITELEIEYEDEVQK
jgi:hypothetical protein